MKNIDYQRWEDDEFVITIDGKPIGQTLHEKDAKIFCKWLRHGGYDEIVKECINE